MGLRSSLMLGQVLAQANGAVVNDIMGTVEQRNGLPPARAKKRSPGFRLRIELPVIPPAKFVPSAPVDGQTVVGASR